MKSIRRRVSANQRNIFLGFLVLIALVTFSYINFINPLISHAESQYMTATIVDDNGEVDFSPGIDDAVAKFSYVHSGSNSSDSNIYSSKIILTNLPLDKKKTLKITLPVGMAWVDDASGDQNLLSQLDSSQGNNGIGTIADSHEPIKGYNFTKAGSRAYYLSNGASALTINVKIKVDSVVNLTYINDAIVAALLFDDEEVESGTLDVDVPTGASQPGQFHVSSRTVYVPANSEYSENLNGFKGTYAFYVIGYFGVNRMVDSVKWKINVSNTNANIKLDNSNNQYTLDGSDSSNGNYVITYSPDAAYIGSSLVVPYTIVVPDGLAAGEKIVVTLSGETSYWQPDGSIITTPYSNTSKITFVVLPNTANGVTVGFNSLDPSSSNTSNDIVFNSPIKEGDKTTGLLGHAFINNKSSLDSSEKRMRLKFDTDALGVMQVRLSCRPNGKIEKIHVETVSGVSKDVSLNLACNSYGGTNTISYADLGILRDDYISELEYDIGSIPAATQLHWAATNDLLQAVVFMGKRLDSSKDGISTIEVFDTDNPDNTTGIAKITTKSGRAPGADISPMATQIVNAGQPLKFNGTIADYGGTMNSYLYGFNDPVIYIRSEVKDGIGNLIPISNIKITNGASRGNEDITSKFSILCGEISSSYVCKMDSSSITDGSASITSSAVSLDGKLSSNQLQVSFTINTDLTTPDQTHDIKSLILLEAADKGSITSRSNKGDVYGITGNNNTIYAATTNYYQIRGWASIGVENSGKHTSSDSWLTWSEGGNPITIGSAEGSLADMKATMINNSGVEVPGPTTIYLPIPKKDQNWGSLSYNNSAFEFSTALTGAISNPDAAHFSIAYGKNVTPSDNGTNLSNENSKFTTNTSGWTTSDWEAVNCIKITATDIPANQPGAADNYDFIYKLKVIDSANAADGAVDTWRPLYFQQLTNSAGDIFAGWYKGSYVSIKLADGKVSGQIFLDANENGKKDAGETDLREAGWKVDLYDRASNKLVRSTETDADGKYSFIELAMNADGYYVTVTNKHPIDGTGTTYLFTKKGTASTSSAYNTDNQAEGNKTSTPAHTTAYIGPVSPSKTTGEATYNIGVVVYVATESYSGTVTFNDQNNKFNTRPANVAITATASDGSTQTITATAGNWTKDLPKYNASGEKLSYSFSTPDLTNYTKSDETKDNGYTYNVSHTQKTATLTVNHYKKGTTEKLANTETSTVYWGQTYTTAQAAVDSNYEYDSVSGTASGTVSGDVTVTYYYKLKRGTVITHYYIKDTITKISEDASKEYNYTEEYETSPLAAIPDAFKYYELVSDKPEGYKGTVSKPTTEVTYYYQLKKGTLTVHHYKNGTTEKLADDVTSTVEYGTTYTTQATTVDSNYELVSTPSNATGTFEGDVIVTYYYKLKRGTVITHYYIKDTTTKIADDVSKEYNYTETYETSPLAEVPAPYANYELVSDEPEGYKGTVSAPTTEVIYYYQKKDAQLSSGVTIEAPETVNNKSAKISYTIEYSADIKDYIGNITITLVDKLPYPIDEDASDITDGIYDAEAQTITWTIAKAYNTYTDGEEVSVKKEIELVYVGASARDSLLNTIEGNITLDSKDNDAADSTETTVRTPSKIIYRYTDIYGNEIIEEVEDDGIVGDISDHRPPEIPGYTLVPDTDADLTFEEDEKTITYHYEKNPEPVAPKTGDNIAVTVTIGAMATAGAGIVFARKRR